MKKRIEIQLIILLLCGLVFAAAWIGIQVARDKFGTFSEPLELNFTTEDLSGLALRSELRCSGTVVGHVRDIKSKLDAKAKNPTFMIVAGIKKDFASWKFSRDPKVEIPFVLSSLTQSSIQLTIDPENGFQPVEPEGGALREAFQNKKDATASRVPTLTLKRAESINDLSGPKKQVMDTAAEIQNAIKKFTVPPQGKSLSVIDELTTVSIPHLTKTMAHLEEIAASINGQSHQTGTDPASRPPIEQILVNIKGATGSLSDAANKIRESLVEGGDVNKVLKTLDAKLDALGTLIKTTEKAVGDLQGQVARMGIDKTLRKMDGLIDESTATVATLHKKAEGLGTTFMSRMFIGKQEKAPASPPAKPPAKTPRSSR